VKAGAAAELVKDAHVDGEGRRSMADYVRVWRKTAFFSIFEYMQAVQNLLRLFGDAVDNFNDKHGKDSTPAIKTKVDGAEQNILHLEQLQKFLTGPTVYGAGVCVQVIADVFERASAGLHGTPLGVVHNSVHFASTDLTVIDLLQGERLKALMRAQHTTPLKYLTPP
jgi:hypothetical protein